MVVERYAAGGHGVGAIRAVGFLDAYVDGIGGTFEEEQAHFFVRGRAR